MKKKILSALIGITVLVGGIVAVSAYEAHIINVTAHIENALKVHPLTGILAFGTMFPQEYRTRTMTVTTSDSFCQPTQRRVLNIDYKIVQKPKCQSDTITDKSSPLLYKPLDYATEECPQGYHKMPSLCPYLSKTPKQIDPTPYTDHGVSAFHDPSDPLSIATGTINKDHDIGDDWIIDLPVPCFKGYCAQDWPEFVEKYNPDVDPHDYELVGDPNGTDLGCDLWVEVTKIY